MLRLHAREPHNACPQNRTLIQPDGASGPDVELPVGSDRKMPMDTDDSTGDGRPTATRQNKQNPGVAKEQRERGNLRLGNLFATPSNADPCAIKVFTIVAQHEVSHFTARAATEEEAQALGGLIMQKEVPKEKLREGRNDVMATVSEFDVAGARLVQSWPKKKLRQHGASHG